MHSNKKAIMKNAILALSLMISASAWADPIGIVEYDFDRVQNQSIRSNYGAVGVVFPTQYGAFDVFAQASRSYTDGVKDNLHGYELGYSQFIELKSINVIPRIAFGTMRNINLGDINGNAKYLLASVEAQKKINDTYTAFVSVSHMNGLNSSAISASNRVMAGFDVVLDEKVTLRTAYSFKKQLATNVNGVVVMLSYTF